MDTTTRWGIISTGRIARDFATGLAYLPEAELIAVGSRSRDTAEAFGERFGVPRCYSSYEALAGDPDVEVVYIGTPHTCHAENSLLCLRSGKAVLCEKPFAINAREAEEMIRTARERNLFLMEAMWTRFLPVMVKVRELLAEGVIGQARLLQADFGFRAGLNPLGRLFNPQLGGGALLDVGVYAVSFASMIFGGPPSRIATMAHLGETNVDEQGAMIFGYDGGAMAVLTCAIRTSTGQEATISGTDGSIKIHNPWWKSEVLTLSRPDAEDEVIETLMPAKGFHLQAAEVMTCLRRGKIESEIMPLDESLSIMKTMDAIRSQWGLRYPSE